MTPNPDLAIILTVRMESERLPGKALAQIADKPLTYWIVKRLQDIGQVVLATTTSAADVPLVDLARQMGIPFYRGPINDVVTRMHDAYHACLPNARYIMRGLGDCPFMAGELIARMVEVMERQHGEAFQWALAPYCTPVYGAREFPYSKSGWAKVNSGSCAREHIDQFFHQNRRQFKVLYHEPPPTIYFRPYRLEVDWQEDYQLVKAVGEQGPGMLAPLPEIVKWLDEHPKVAGLNHGRVERTGPSCYSYRQQRGWITAMMGSAIMDWDDRLWQPPAEQAVPMFCASGQCFLGYGHNGVLYSRAGQIRGDAWLSCACGAGLRWGQKISR